MTSLRLGSNIPQEHCRLQMDMFIGLFVGAMEIEPASSANAGRMGCSGAQNATKETIAVDSGKHEGCNLFCIRSHIIFISLSC